MDLIVRILRWPGEVEEEAKTQADGGEKDPAPSTTGSDQPSAVGVPGSSVATEEEALAAVDASDKILVFSQWVDTIGILSIILKELGIPFIVMRSTQNYESVSQFRRESGIRVMLMLLSQGNNGLDLVEARHVILVDPILSPTLESQAIARVRRIGQTRTSFVHSLVVKDTIEEKIYRLCSQRAQDMSLGKRISVDASKEFLMIEDVKSLMA